MTFADSVGMIKTAPLKRAKIELDMRQVRRLESNATRERDQYTLDLVYSALHGDDVARAELAELIRDSEPRALP